MLLVTCCKEPSRAAILRQVVDNLKQQVPAYGGNVCVFDNASTEPGIKELLLANFANVYQADHNVGYWSAIDWWLDSLQGRPPDYTYIIESDMIHHAFHKLSDCVDYLDARPAVGSVRLLEYSIARHHLYNKDAPVLGSRVSAWQAHTNKVTGQKIVLDHDVGEVWRTNFLTQLPALNRYPAMLESFRALRGGGQFTEVDFQRLYWERYQATGILDGGIYNGELSVDTANNAAIGSWTSASTLKQMGYHTTRVASIALRSEYTVSRLT